VYINSYGRRVRELIWGQVSGYIEEGNAVIASSGLNEFDTRGRNGRVPIDLDDFRLGAFGEEATLPSEAGPLAGSQRRRGRR
jgi:CRISPR-associated protein Cas2